jgi:hypothetical protein
MDAPTAGNPALPAATASAAKQEPQAPSQEPPHPEQALPQTQAVADGLGRSRAELEQLADEVISIFEDSPERLEELVATLKRLDTEASGGR